MTITLPRMDRSDVTETMFLRPKRPDDHRDFEMVLPWMTPLFVYADRGLDWVRWSIPRPAAERFGFRGGCACCGESTVTEGEVGDIHVDTAWHETDWWLQSHGYRKSTEKEGQQS